MLSSLIITESEHEFKELEELLLAHDFTVEFAHKLNSEISKVSKLEFEYDIFFLLREPVEDEIPAVSRLSKTKVFFYQPDPIILLEKSKRSEHWFNMHGVNMGNLLWVFDHVKNTGKEDEILLSAASMKGKLEYFKGVEEIAIFKPFHLDAGWETILNGNESTKAMLGDLAIRTGKDIVLSQRKENMVFFAGDLLSNKPMKSGDNKRFVVNLLGSMLTGAELVGV